MPEDNKPITVVLIAIREMSADFFEPYMEMSKDLGIDLPEDFKAIGQHSINKDHGFTKIESYYRILRKEEEENVVRDCVKQLRKLNARNNPNIA